MGVRAVLGLMASVLLVACGGNDDSTAQASAGQVMPRSGQAKVSFYAASRFAEQATFGATPALVAEQQKVADAFAQLGLIPKPIRVADIVWLPGQALASAR